MTAPAPAPPSRSHARVIAVLLAVLNGVVIMILSMLGEYVVRTLNAVSAVTTYHVAERVSGVSGQ